MRIGYVLKCFPRLSETFILTEVLGLERLGWDLTIFTRRDVDEPICHGAVQSLRAKVINLGPLLRQRLWEPFEIHRRLACRLGRAHETAFQAALELRSRDEMRAWLLAGAVAEQALAEDFDLIHAHFATGSASIARYASRLTGTPFTFTAHAKDIYWQGVDLGRLRLLEEEAETVVTISEANRVFLRSIAPSARVKRVYNGIDLERIPFNNEPEDFFIAVGRMTPGKGIAEAIRIARRANARLLIVGQTTSHLPWSEQYFSKEIQPHIDGDAIRHSPPSRGT